MSNKTYTSQLVIEMIDDETGERMYPANTLIDATYGLSEKGVLAHHYALKIVYAHAILAAGDNGDEEAAVRASTE